MRNDLFLALRVHLILVAILVMTVFSLVSLAEEPAPAAPVQPIPWWVDLLWKAVVPGLATIIAIIWGIMKTKYHLDEGQKAEAAKIAETAVKATYDELVRGLKAAHADGKLTGDEIKQATSMAWGKAVAIGKERGLDFAKIVSEQYFPVVCDKIIKALKK